MLRIAHEGTEDLLILDHAGNSLRNGLVTDISHTKLDQTRPGERQEHKQAERLPKECGNCGALQSGLVCPFCGHEKKPSPGVETVDGSLVEITPAKAKASKAEKQHFWAMALWVDRERGKGGKLAKGLYKGKYGVWPRGLAYEHTPPDMAFLNYEKSRRIAYAKRMQKERNNVSR